MVYTLQDERGKDTEPGLETIQLLARTHFPKATADIPQQSYSARSGVDAKDLDGMFKWISPELTRRALRQFKAKKAPGPDGIRPVIFKYLPPNVIKYLTTIYEACMALGYTPLLWRQCKVIFLPKPGKASYRTPKSFRPISLSNYFLKTMERLVVWRVDETLPLAPIHKRQHGFTKGMSTESALSAVIDMIEKYLFKHQHCLAVFLDISAAFDSIDINHVRDMLFKHGADEDLVRWYFGLLQDRRISIKLHGETLHLTTGVGFPQGGVASA